MLYKKPLMCMKSNGGVSGISRQKTSGAKANVQVQVIPTAKTIPEANALAVSLGLAKDVDFRKIDINNANLIIQSLFNIKAQFPQLEQLRFVGSSSIYGGKKGCWASFFSALGVPIGMTFSEKYFAKRGINNFLEKLKENIQSQYHPVGCDTIKSVIDHEIGHYLDYGRVKGTSSTGLQLSRDSQILKIWQGMTKQETKEKLSDYANDSIREFIAESWAEYQNNPHPRATAKAVSDRIIEIYQTK